MTVTDDQQQRTHIVDIFSSIIQSLGSVASIVLEFLKAFGIAG